MKPKLLIKPWLLLLMLAGCTSLPSPEGQSLVEQGKWREGLPMLEAEAAAQPDNLQLRGAVLRARELAARQLLAQADQLRADNRLDEAGKLYREYLQRFGENARVSEGLQAVTRGREHAEKIAAARTLMQSGKGEEARRLLKSVLAENRNQAEAQALLKELNEAARPAAAELDPALNKTITLEFRDAPIGQVFQALSQLSGLNFILDKDIPADLRTTIYARNTPLASAIQFILTPHHLDRKIINANTVLVYPKTPDKMATYQDKVVKSFYLSNADPKAVLNLLKTVLKTRDVYVDERLNLVVLRDTPEVVDMAEKLIAMQDMADPEVMLEVEVLEVKRSRLAELGIQFPNQLSVITPPPIAPATTSLLTLFDLKNLTSANVGVTPNPALNMKREDSDVNLLANPRIRVKNREKARIHIGDRVPVITTTSTANVGISESVSYLDVGLKLDVEPNISLSDEVGIKVGLEVSNIVKEITSENGTLVYQVGTRNAATNLRLKHGETQILAGLISDEDRKTANKLPGLGEIPMLGRLFSSNRDEHTKTEIVLLITPHILRNLNPPDARERQFNTGADNNFGSAPLNLLPETPQPPAPALPRP
jgi:general secretion pathway protein D